MKKRKDGYYKVTKSINGIQKCFYGKSRAEAIRKRDEFLNRKESIVFRNVAEEWWEEHSFTLAYNSLKGLKPAYERAVQEFGDMFITEITPSELSKYIREFASKGYADKTVRTQLGVFSMVFKYAINYRGVNIQNPARDVVIPRGLPKRKITLPPDEDIQKVKDNVTLPFGLFPYMLMYSGLRRGELLCLRYDDCRDGFITVNKSLYYVNNKPMVKEPKTERGKRRIPILNKLAPYIKSGKGIIFNYKGNYLPQHIFDRYWNDYCKAVGINCTPHQLRHCFATMLYEGDISPKDAQYLLGHSQLSTTMDIYTDIRQQREKDIAEGVKSIDIRVDNRV